VRKNSTQSQQTCNVLRSGLEIKDEKSSAKDDTPESSDAGQSNAEGGGLDLQQLITARNARRILLPLYPA